MHFARRLIKHTTDEAGGPATRHRHHAALIKLLLICLPVHSCSDESAISELLRVVTSTSHHLLTLPLPNYCTPVMPFYTCCTPLFKHHSWRSNECLFQTIICLINKYSTFTLMHYYWFYFFPFNEFPHSSNWQHLQYKPTLFLKNRYLQLNFNYTHISILILSNLLICFIYLYISSYFFHNA